MSKKRDHLETSTSMIVGAVLNYCLTLILFDVTATKGVWTTAIFFVISYSRTYLIRRWFRGKDNES